MNSLMRYEMKNSEFCVFAHEFLTLLRANEIFFSLNIMVTTYCSFHRNLVNEIL